MTTMHVHRWGTGPEVVLVHGVLLGGREAWRAQRPLTERWTLVAPDRPGHGRSPAARQDFETESVLVAEQLLDHPVHLVGMSYGAIVAMYAAGLRPENVRTLTVIEPPCTGVVEGDVSVDAYARKVRALTELADLPPAEALRRMFRTIGVSLPVTEPIPAVLAQGLRQVIGARPPDEARPPLDRLRAAKIPILVVTGDHMHAYEVIADTIAKRTEGGRAIIPGHGHLVPDSGAPFNAMLERHLTTR